MGCSKCGAVGVNILTCPWAGAKNPNYAGHAKQNPLAAKPAPVAAKPAPVAVKPAPVAVEAGPKPKAKAKAKAKVPVEIDPGLEFERKLDAIRAEAKHFYPDDPDIQEEYVADYIRLQMPSVPKNTDPVSKMIKEQEMTLTSNCELCLRAIKGNSLIKEPTQWAKVSNVCKTCYEQIAKKYHSSSAPYKNYSKSLTVEDIAAHGAKDNYYNATMYHAAKHWSDVAVRRAVQALPNVPN